MKTLLDLGQSGSRLTVKVTEASKLAGLDRTFDAFFEAEAHPFAGGFADALFEDDLIAWRNSLDGWTAPGSLLLGGGRSAELRLTAEPQIPGGPDLWVVEATLSRSGDDPYPMLRFLIFNVEPFADAAHSAVESLLT